MHCFVWRRAWRAVLAALVACGVQTGARAAPVPAISTIPVEHADRPAREPVLLAQNDSTRVSGLPAQADSTRMPVLLAQAGRGLGVLAPALPMPVKPQAPVGVTAELLPCSVPEASAEAAAPAAADPAGSAPARDAASGLPPASNEATAASSPDAQAGDDMPASVMEGCPVVPTAASEAADATAGGLDLDYVPLPPGSTPVKWGRPLGTPKPWFSSVTPEGGMQLGDRSLTYRSVDGPSVSLGSLTPFAPAWSSAATIGGVQVSNLSASSDSTVPEGKLGYSSVWGRINNTDPAMTAGGVQYGVPAGSNAVRYGLTPDVTLEGQVQSARALTTTGLGTTYSMGEWGTLQGGATQSHFDAAQGWRYNLGYNVKVFDTVRLGYGNELTSSGYGDLSTYQDGTTATSQFRNTFSAGVPISGWGELSGTYSGLRDTSGEMLERRYGISQSMMLSPNVRLAVGADHDVITGDYGVNMQLTMPLGGR
ncbi:hypothetical protein CAL12_05550 [Bordetella genomosp. 8]|uniref:Fimbrial protein n=1 Tax=Bordetella genomosp. 8 TaxID=1416806 RepID=A0A1W6YH34_9BORD|nr:hypothetical protein [Bordetella genomosp. 8]ARP80350.1 hypothetical protein CAL12_05550 [Bordetella genomosp. 8]